MKILFTRHGQTSWNIEMKIQGHVEIPLNELGIKQAEELRDKLKDEHIDVIISSPLERAKVTAEIINEFHNLPILIDDRIIEQYYGSLEGSPRNAENTIYQMQRRSFFKRYPGGESYMDVAAMVYSFLNEVALKYKGKTVLIVAHGGISRVVNTYFRDMENDEFVEYGIDNCELVEYYLPD